MSLMDNLSKILIALAIIIAAALLLGYRKKLPGMASKIKEHI
jgi:Sec-independent protein translocase protein TatA